MAQRNNDQNRFIVPEVDPFGRSAWLALRVPPSLNESLEKFSESNFRFETKADLIRWCLEHGVETLEFMEPPVCISPILRLSLLVARTNIHTNTFHEFFAELNSVMNQVTTDRHLCDRAPQVIKAIHELILCMPSAGDGCLYLGELIRQWGHLMPESKDSQVVGADGE